MARNHGIYIASKVKHAQRWLDLKAKGYPFNSRWLTAPNDMTPEQYAELWGKISQDVMIADALILYVELGEVLKGALIEMGMAMANNTPVYVVGEYPGFTAIHCGGVTVCKTLDEALEKAAEDGGYDWPVE